MVPEVRLASLVVGGRTDAWMQLGFTVDADGRIALTNGALRVEAARPAGVLGWELAGDLTRVQHDRIDGVPTWAGSASVSAVHHNGAVEIDHVVIMSDSLDRTCEAVTKATGAELKRIREAGPVRQGFHRLGRRGVIVEVVERRDLDGASLWGVVVNVADLDAVVADLGPTLIGAAKPAVQPGRRIATVRSEAGLGVPVALMDLPDRPAVSTRSC